MSRDLPPRPNLDHLKKQAKELLQTLKQQDPDAQLADAQRALAREYGFASWPRLKTHVESEMPAQNRSSANGRLTYRDRSCIRSIAFRPLRLDSTSQARR